MKIKITLKKGRVVYADMLDLHNKYYVVNMGSGVEFSGIIPQQFDEIESIKIVDCYGK
jgi:hypothetical protein